MGVGYLTGQGGGTKINGIIEEYTAYAGENISIGDFVEFVNTNLAVVGSPVQVSPSFSNEISAIAMSDSAVLVVYFQDGAVSAYTTAQVLTISGTTITYGTKVTVAATTTGYGMLKKISSTKAILAYISDYTNNYGVAMVLSVSGTTVSLGSFINFNLATTSNIAIEVLDSNRVLVAYSNNYLPTAQVLTISGTTLSAGTKYVINSASNSSSTSLSLIEQDKVIMGFTHISGSYNVGDLKILLINGTAINMGPITTFNSLAALNITCVATSKNYGFVVYTGFMANSTAYYLHIVPVEFNGTTVVCGSDAPYTLSVVYEYTSVCKVSDGCYILAFDVGDSAHIGRAILINTRGNSVSIKGNALAYSSVRTYYSKIVSLSNSVLMAIYNDSTNSVNKTLLMAVNNYVRNAASKNTIDGIAKTKAAAGETAKIYTL